MFRLPIVATQDAKGAVKKTYSDVESLQGEPHLLLQLFANDPEVLRAEWQLEKALMYGRSVLSKRLRQYISLTVAILHGCTT